MSDNTTVEQPLSPSARADGIRYLLDRRFRIQYFVPFPREELEDASPLRLYSNTLMHSADLHLLAARLPADIRELSLDWSTIAKLRCIGAIEHAIVPIYLDAFEEAAPLLNDMPFRCVLSDETTIYAIDSILKKTSDRWLHLSTVDREDTLNPVDLTWAVFSEALREVVGPSAVSTHRAYVEIFEQEASGTILEPTRPLLHPARNHGVTTMNEFAVTSLGAILGHVKPLIPNGKMDYKKAILNSIDEVKVHRDWLESDETSIRYHQKLCLAVPSVLSHLYENTFSKKNSAKFEQPELHRLALALVRQNKYIFEADKKFLMAISTPAGQILMRLNQIEMQTFVTSLALFASRTLAPVLRLEPSLNGIRPLLARIASLSRGENPHRTHKINIAVSGLLDTMKKVIPASYLKLIGKRPKDPHEGIKIVADLPLEWLPVGKLPLMMAFETSRDPVTPGNVSFSQISKFQTQYLFTSSFTDVLVIRSYTDDDPIRDVLVQTLEKLPDDSPLTINVKVVDVANSEEFINAWNAFDGAILIFDGHGISDPDSDIGQLIIAGKPVVIWDLKEKLTKSPPIVVLSACDTHSLDTNHATIANTMLMLGAITVLGTVLPINALYAATFVRRILLRVAAFIPLVAASDISNPTTWRSVVTGMQRMQYVTEIMLSLEKNAQLDLRAAFDEIQFQSNVEINEGQADWFERFVARLAEKTSRSTDAIHLLIRKWASILDVMHYVQLGNPEAILILKDELNS